MKKQVLLLIGLMFVAANVAAAQTRRATNADLEKFRQNRVQTERDYRENYQRLGLPSPEELEKRREQNRLELAELSARLQNESLAREQRQRENEFRQSHNEYLRGGSQYNRGASYGNGYYSSGFYGAYPYYGATPYGYSNGYNNYGWSSYGYSNGYNYGFYAGQFNNNRGLQYGARFNNRGFRGGRIYNNPLSIFQASGFGTNRGGVRIGISSGTRSSISIGSPR